LCPKDFRDRWTGLTQRNYLQALHAEVADTGVYVGAAGEQVWEMPTVDPGHLADLLWTMPRTKGQREAVYP
jgi:hypothetical protein